MMRDELLTCACDSLTPAEIGELQRRARVLALDVPLQQVRMQCLKLAVQPRPDSLAPDLKTAACADEIVAAARLYFDFVIGRTTSEA